VPRLVAPTDAHIDALMQWFPDAASVAVWSPSNSYPFNDRVRFLMETKLDELASFFLVDERDAPLAFGQYYERLGCCHLGRLVVAPERRSEGLGSQLIRELMQKGASALNLQRCSLFVLDYNVGARKLYHKLGFRETQYPENMPLERCLYLTAELPRTSAE
jgi:RimJ/RimL family protein N-acetyltransferase